MTLTSIGFTSIMTAAAAFSDDIWAQILMPPIMALVWLVGSSRILSLARAGGELDQDRPRLNFYSTIVILLVMYVASFHLELANHWRFWGAAFLVGCFVLLAVPRLRYPGDQAALSQWKKILVGWALVNASAVIIVSIFRYFGN